jgi:spore germination protein PF
MVSRVGNLKIDSVSGGVVLFGNAFIISPNSISKSISGAGSSLTGDLSTTNTLFNLNLTRTVNPLP